MSDSARVKRAEWLVTIGICTRLGCIPKGQEPAEPVGPWGGWYCVWHGSIDDMDGRIRRGPVPNNSYLPPYEFIGNGLVRIG